MMVGFLRSTRFALQNVFRNWWLSVTTVFILVLTMLTISIVGGLNIVGRELITAIQQKVDINLYFYDHVKENEILAAQTYLQHLPGVADVLYISKDDALEAFRKRHENDKEFLESLNEAAESAVPASLVVRAGAIADYASIAEQFRASPYAALVEGADFDDSQALIMNMTRVITKATNVGAAMSFIFVIIAVIVIFNMIRLTIYSHREEVAIMKLVGATNWFIRAPFVLEAILLGVVSALITLVVFTTLVVFAEPSVHAFFIGYDFSLQQFFVAHLASVILGEIAIAVAFSIISSMIAITRYLKI